MLEKLLSAIKALFAAKGIQIGENEPALKAELEKVIKENPSGEIDLSKLDLSKFGNTDNEKLLAAVLQNQTKLESALTSIATMVKESSDKMKNDQATHDADVKAAVDNLIVTKKAFPESMREHLTSMATANLDSFKEIYKEAKTGKEFLDKATGEKNSEDKTIIKSTAGNAKALEAIQKFQANSVTSN